MPHPLTQPAPTKPPPPPRPERSLTDAMRDRGITGIDVLEYLLALEARARR